MNECLYQVFIISDVNECLVPNACEPNAICDNTFLSYTCDCFQGYQKELGICQGYPNNLSVPNCDPGRGLAVNLRKKCGEMR